PRSGRAGRARARPRGRLPRQRARGRGPRPSPGTISRGSDMSVLLTVDVGNTNTVLGLHDGADLKVHWRLTTRRGQTADEYGLLVRNLFAVSGFVPAAVDGVAVAGRV